MNDMDDGSKVRIMRAALQMEIEVLKLRNHPFAADAARAALNGLPPESFVRLYNILRMAE